MTSASETRRISGGPDRDGVKPTVNGVAPAYPTPNSAVRGGIEHAGQMVRFAGQMIREIPTTVRLYPSEIFRHAGLLIRQNAAVILFMTFMLGALLGLTAHFIFESLGIGSYIGAAHTIGGMRGITEIVFGWILAAKVGCGIVAELGAMKISEEIDAMEVMGIRSVAYLASSRLAAAIVVIPLIWIMSLSVEFIGGYLFNVVLLGTVSPGGFIYYLFLFQNITDFLFALFWGTLLGLVIISVACFYGYQAKGGPVGVGRSTAQSMLVNLVLVSLIAMCLVQLFYGNSPNAPIGN
jgi:phospholipid/cholesterol/gamma-HCH transport system permease protein